MSQIYTYHGNYYTRLYHHFIIEIEAESFEEANAKAEAYLKDKTNHESIVEDADVECDDNLRLRDHIQYFQENAEIVRCEEEDGDEIEEFDGIALNN